MTRSPCASRSYIRLEQINKAQGDLDPKGLSAWQLFGCALCCLVYSLAAEDPGAIASTVATALETPQVLGGVLYTALIGTTASVQPAPAIR